GLRRTLRTAHSRLVPPVGAARSRRPGRHPNRLAEAAPGRADLPLRPFPAIPRLAQNGYPPRLARLRARPPPGGRRRRPGRERPAANLGGAGRPGGAAGRSLRTGAAGTGPDAGAPARATADVGRLRPDRL